jgi:type IV pilus assembly protein PilV
MRLRKFKLPHRQTGSSLLEVLVSILIMSIGLLGLAGMTVSSLQYAKMAQFQTVGSQLAASYGESIRGNITGFMAGNYNQAAAYTGATAAVAVPVCATPSKCTAAELAAIDLAEWNNNLRRRLPGGGAFVTRDLPADPLDLASNTLAADIWVLYADPTLGFGASNLSVATSGGNQCPALALAGLSATVPVPRCMYFRVSL